MDIFTNNMFFGIFISLVAFEIGLFIYKINYNIKCNTN